MLSSKRQSSATFTASPCAEGFVGRFLSKLTLFREFPAHAGNSEAPRRGAPLLCVLVGYYGGQFQIALPPIPSTESREKGREGGLERPRRKCERGACALASLACWAGSRVALR
jgi:hypothetical protein